MGTAAWRVRAGVLVLVGTLGVHQGRYLAGGHPAEPHAHGYLAWLAPLLCALLVLALAEFGWQLARPRPAEPPPWRARWALLTVLLLAIFVLQESLEAATLQAAVVDGGWLALPLSAFVGAVIALLLHGARALVARRHRRRPAARGEVPPRVRPGWTPSANVLARHLAGRAPPAVGL